MDLRKAYTLFESAMDGEQEGVGYKYDGSDLSQAR